MFVVIMCLGVLGECGGVIPLSNLRAYEGDERNPRTSVHAEYVCGCLWSRPLRATMLGGHHGHVARAAHLIGSGGSCWVRAS